MEKSRFSEEQMVTILREADRMTVAEAAKKHKVSDATICAWRKHFGQMETADVKRLKALELENSRLKMLLAERGAREALLSLLVDLKDGRQVEEVRQERDRLNAALEDIYKAAPRTDSKAYAAAQKALKEAEELFFTDEELNKMLPKQLRSASPSKL